MATGRFLAMVGALIWRQTDGRYLLLQRAATKDFAAGQWECVTGRLEQGERFEQNLVDLDFDPPFPNAPAFRAVVMAADAAFTARFRPRVVSSSMALTWVATGQRAAYITDGDMRDSVHFAAGLAICQAAGCIVTDLRGGMWGRGATGLVAAADAETHAALMAIVRQYLD